MDDLLAGKTAILGVTGSIACYKAADLASRLVKAKVRVNVVMTSSAVRMIAPVTFQSITANPVITDLFECEPGRIEHIALAHEADIMIIAPATANTIAKIACGLADNALTTIVLATIAPIIFAPAMESHMYQNPTTQENLQKLIKRGHTIAGPASGRLASGSLGPGRMFEPEQIVACSRDIFSR